MTFLLYKNKAFPSFLVFYNYFRTLFFKQNNAYISIEIELYV